MTKKEVIKKFSVVDDFLGNARPKRSMTKKEVINKFSVVDDFFGKCKKFCGKYLKMVIQ